MVSILIISIILIALGVAILGIKVWFSSNAEIMAHACDFDPEKRKKKNIDCDQCELKEIVNCEKE